MQISFFNFTNIKKSYFRFEKQKTNKIPKYIDIESIS